MHKQLLLPNYRIQSLQSLARRNASLSDVASAAGDALRHTLLHPWDEFGGPRVLESDLGQSCLESLEVSEALCAELLLDPSPHVLLRVEIRRMTRPTGQGRDVEFLQRRLGDVGV